MSAPAQNADPDPVSTTARTSSSSAASSKAAASRRNSSRFSALRLSGRCSRMRRTCGSGSSMRITLSDDKQDVSFLDEVAFFDADFPHLTAYGSRNGDVHFHRLQN